MFDAVAVGAKDLALFHLAANGIDGEAHANHVANIEILFGSAEVMKLEGTIITVAAAYAWM
jgi:hypothetical protein